MTKPSTPVKLMIGEKSAETSQIPVHCRSTRSLRRNGNVALIFLAQLASELNVDCIEYEGCGSNSAPINIWPRAVWET